VAEHEGSEASGAVGRSDRCNDPAVVGELHLDAVCVPECEEVGGLPAWNGAEWRALHSACGGETTGSRHRRAACRRNAKNEDDPNGSEPPWYAAIKASSILLHSWR